MKKWVEAFGETKRPVLEPYSPTSLKETLKFTAFFDVQPQGSPSILTIARQNVPCNGLISHNCIRLYKSPRHIRSALEDCLTP